MPWNKDGTRKKSSTYKMKYQGNHGAFPFKGLVKSSVGKIEKESPLDLAIISPAIERGIKRFDEKQEIKDLQHKQNIATIEANIEQEEKRKRDNQRKVKSKTKKSDDDDTGGDNGGGWDGWVPPVDGGTDGTGDGGDGTGNGSGTGGSGGGAGGSGGGGGGA